MRANKHYPVLNPLEVMDFLEIPEEKRRHITYDPNLKHQYQVIRNAVHDGSYYFTLQVFNDVFDAIIDKTTSAKSLGELPPGFTIEYIIGDVKWDIEHKSDTMMEDILYLPVISKYVKEETIELR